MAGEDPKRITINTRAGWVVGMVMLTAAIIGFVAVYEIAPPSGNVENATCSKAGAFAPKLKALAKGGVAALNVLNSPKLLRNLNFQAPDGTAINLSAFRGKTVLLNLWATWCAPCRTEMPTLDRLQAKLGGPDFEVVAVNIDTRDLERAEAFLNGVKVTQLKRYKDPTAQIFQELKSTGKAFGMPTSILINSEGCEIANLAGPADWAGEDALSFVKAAIGQ